VGASVTKLFGPALIGAVPAAGFAGIVPGGWRIVPVAYAALLTVLAVCLFWLAPADIKVEGGARPIGQMLRPLRHARVWRFSLYYVVVFGAYVALSLTLPKYYMTRYGLTLTSAGLLAALFIFPASLLRPLGGYLSDRLGPRILMYGVFGVMLACSAFLALDGGAGFRVALAPFVAIVFVVGVAMGIGKAAVYKYVAEYFPKDVAAVGGLVGALGALGGFVLPLLFSYLRAWSGLSAAPFIVLLALTGVSLGWLHAAVQRAQRSGPLTVVSTRGPSYQNTR
jgi:NNP family nitrate/nitrite transporter-like MFS transporter